MCKIYLDRYGIELSKFVNKFIIYQIAIKNTMVILID